MRLSELQTGGKAIIVKVLGHGSFRKRIIEMGFVRGKEVESVLNAPLRDPIKYRIMGYEVSLRKNEASLIEVMPIEEFDALQIKNKYHGVLEEDRKTLIEEVVREKQKLINVALVGNPNSGKTSLFNYISKSNEHVGNYSGVTVEAKEGFFQSQGYKFRIMDLPGTYSMSSYSPEELYVRHYVVENTPDIIINVVDASNLERNLYLTTQLIDMNVPMVIALNMYDELERSGNKLDHLQLSKLLGVPIVPTVSKTGFGVDTLFHVAINLYEGCNFFNSNGEINPELFLREFEHHPRHKHEHPEGEEHPMIYEVFRHIHINHGPELESAISAIQSVIQKEEPVRAKFSTRFLAIKLLEGDNEIEQIVRKFENGKEILRIRDAEEKRISSLSKEDTESLITNAKYGFIAGALRETFTESEAEMRKETRIIDYFVTHKVFGFPIFFLFLWIMFECTFKLGSYPMSWLESLIGWGSSVLKEQMADGMLKDLLIEGIIGGVGGVIVFLPNILILYLFISFMEDSGYMARAAFIMDRVMHKMGLHGKSFIPLIMGFGCNVPAIMGTRIIENRNSRMITMLIIPFMSCGARLPIYLLFAGIFFPQHGSLVLLALYLTGILAGVLVSKFLRKFVFTEEEAPFVLELPPYRMPTFHSVLIHVWDKTKQYLKKMGGIILVASIVIWFLGYFPRSAENEEMRKQTYIEQLGHLTEPVIRPLGFTWEMGVSLVSGIVAKETIISTLGVLYTGDSDTVSLSEKLKTVTNDAGEPVYTPLVAFSFMLFVLLYFPCIASVVAIKNESGGWKWAVAALFYTCALAWIVSFTVYQAGRFCGL
ncbi:MAG: ferrous iron transport protein B [Prevotellaceae bacterium]|jgi:ferrous iron transport protein B|nr:ferrous iron transport protein B [Prevotellaceae bacterium]